jgi:hypothetical protein
MNAGTLATLGGRARASIELALIKQSRHAPGPARPAIAHACSTRDMGFIRMEISGLEIDIIIRQYCTAGSSISYVRASMEVAE